MRVVISGYRYYSAELGRWLSRDPIGEGNGYNLYLLTHNNSLNYIDLFGLKSYTDKKGLTDPTLPRGHLDDNDHGSIPGTLGMWSWKQLIKNNLWAFYFVYPDAARHLWHYFSNTGDDLTIRLQIMIGDVPSAKTLFDREKRDAQWFVKSLSEGIHEITSEMFSEGEVTKNDSENWFLAVAGYYAWGKGIAYVCKDKDYKYILEYEYKFYDPYDWHEGLPAAIKILGKGFDDKFMRTFHKMGYAKEYLLKGSIKKTIKWNDGEEPKILNGWESEYSGRK